VCAHYKTINKKRKKTMKKIIAFIMCALCTVMTWGQTSNTSDVAEYAYDANGNLTKDLNKNITNIAYNALSLPTYQNHELMSCGRVVQCAFH
jgi:hypothetical protein